MRIVNGISIRDTVDELVAPPVAVVVIDVQNDFCHPDGHFARHGKDVSSAERALPALIAFVAAAQARGVPCVFVRQRTEPDGKSDSPAWLRLKTRDGKSSDYTLPDSWGAQLVDGLVPQARDVVIEKYRPDAFLGTALESLLRARALESLIFVGTTTEGCLESSVRSASYRDFYVTVAEDLVFSPNHELHDGSLRLLRQRYPTLPSSSILQAMQRT
jgi:ureidoacrylate peracid hydrolase